MRRRPAALPLATVLCGALVALVVPLGVGVPAHAAGSGVGEAPQRARVSDPASTTGADVVSRRITFSVVNTVDRLFETLAGCGADRRFHTVHARLVGPRRVVEGRAGARRFNLMVHDAGTGGWFWNLEATPERDYATKLAEHGQTSVVLDRLGYDRSVLRNGNRTCLDAQVAMVQQVVQHLRAGKYDLVGRPANSGPRPAAAHIVLHGHGTGALIAQLAVARYGGVDGVVLMSMSNTNPTRLAVSTLAEQGATCLTGVGFAPFGATTSAFSRLLFASAEPRVRQAAIRLRNDTPCGDVATITPAVFVGAIEAAAIDVPVLVMSGRRDARVSPMSPARARTAYSSSPRVTARVINGAGSALPLEKQAPAVRRTVLRWLRGL